jgi:hypothetical protein
MQKAAEWKRILEASGSWDNFPRLLKNEIGLWAFYREWRLNKGGKEIDMSNLENAKKALDGFVDKYVSCATCCFFTEELFGGICDSPESSEPVYFENSSSMCETHEFRDTGLQRQLEELESSYLEIMQEGREW